MQILNFLYLKKIIVELKIKILASMCFVIKMIWFILSMYQMKKIEKCIDILLKKKTLLLNYCLKNSFAEIVYNVLVVTNSC